MGKNKRKRPFGETLRKEYSSIRFHEQRSNGRPREPHQFFATSHSVTFVDSAGSQVVSDLVKKYEIEQVVHKHRNDLCILTAGDNVPDSIKKINWVATEAPSFSAAEKRKRQVKMLQGASVAHSCSPSTIIAELHINNDDVIPLYACVYGTIIELNKSLTPAILDDDPLLDGFLAIILPSGNFPPVENVTTDKTNDNEDGVSEDKKLETSNESTES